MALNPLNIMVVLVFFGIGVSVMAGSGLFSENWANDDPAVYQSYTLTNSSQYNPTGTAKADDFFGMTAGFLLSSLRIMTDMLSGLTTTLPRMMDAVGVPPWVALIIGTVVSLALTMYLLNKFSGGRVSDD